MVQCKGQPGEKKCNNLKNTKKKNKYLNVVLWEQADAMKRTPFLATHTMCELVHFSYVQNM